MTNPLVDRWRQRGMFSVWRYRSSKEWSFTANDAGCEALVDLLNVMEAGKWSGKRSIELTRLRRVALLSYPGDKRKNLAKLVLKYLPPSQAPEDHWVMKEHPTSLEIHFGLSSLVRLRDAVVDISRGNGDYCIGTDSFPLWIWWYVKED